MALSATVMAELDGSEIVMEESRAVRKYLGLDTYSTLEAEQRAVAERIRFLEARKRLEKWEQELKEEMVRLTVGQSRSREGSRRRSTSHDHRHRRHRRHSSSSSSSREQTSSRERRVRRSGWLKYMSRKEKTLKNYMALNWLKLHVHGRWTIRRQSMMTW